MDNRSKLIDLFDYLIEALPLSDRAIQIQPNDFETLINKGNSLASLNRHDEAIECFQESIKLNPDFSTSYSNLGSSLIQLKRYQDALKCFEMAISINSEFAPSYNNLSIAQTHLGKLEEAVKSANKGKYKWNGIKLKLKLLIIDRSNRASTFIYRCL
jgi:tetratricopeptide (TPR) repeat protein